MWSFTSELRRRWMLVPKLLRFLAINCVIGITAGWTVLAMLIFTNVGGIRTLIADSSKPWVPVLLLAAGFAVTFGSAAMGTAVMLIPYSDEDP
jgi:hypothetical protein